MRTQRETDLAKELGDMTNKVSELERVLKEIRDCKAHYACNFCVTLARNALKPKTGATG